MLGPHSRSAATRQRGTVHRIFCAAAMLMSLSHIWLEGTAVSPPQLAMISNAVIRAQPPRTQIGKQQAVHSDGALYLPYFSQTLEKNRFSCKGKWPVGQERRRAKLSFLKCLEKGKISVCTDIGKGQDLLEMLSKWTWIRSSSRKGERVPKPGLESHCWSLAVI